MTARKRKSEIVVLPPEMAVRLVPIDELTPHPQNTRRGDIESIMESLSVHGQYRPIVVQLSTSFIIAGNHTWKAAVRLGWESISAVFVDVNDEQALRILLADNQTSDRATNDDAGLRATLEMLAATDLRLAGTGFGLDDFEALARIQDSLGGAVDPLGEWNGMPKFDQPDRQSAAHVTVHFPTDADCERFFRLLELPRRTSMWWPNSDGLVGSSRLNEQYVSDEP